MEKQDAAEFYSELADWAYANGEAMLMEDEPRNAGIIENQLNPKKTKNHGRNETNDRGNDGRGKGGI